MARILLVDDDKDIRDIGSALLQSAKHDVFTAPGTLAALEFLRSNEVDVLITDANMPQHSGFDLLRTIRRDPVLSARDFGLVMLTGRRERKDIERAVELGCHDYIIKPLDPLLFLQKIKDLLERRPPKAQAQFATLQLGENAFVKLAIELISLSEVGLVMRSNHRFPEGTQLELDSDLFARIGCATPTLRVLSSTEADGLWEARLAFVGADERTLTKVRSWIHGQTVKNASQQNKNKGRKAA